jgi:hypothetical protein
MLIKIQVSRKIILHSLVQRNKVLHQQVHSQLVPLRKLQQQVLHNKVQVQVVVALQVQANWQ